MKTILTIILGVMVVAGIGGLVVSAQEVIERSVVEKADEKVVKVGENHVEVRKLLYDSKGGEVVVETEEYGQDKIDRELESAQRQYDYWNNMTQEKIDAEKAKYQAIIDKLTLIQAEMDK